MKRTKQNWWVDQFPESSTKVSRSAIILEISILIRFCMASGKALPFSLSVIQNLIKPTIFKLMSLCDTLVLWQLVHVVLILVCSFQWCVWLSFIRAVLSKIKVHIHWHPRIICCWVQNFSWRGIRVITVPGHSGLYTSLRSLFYFLLTSKCTIFLNRTQLDNWRKRKRKQRRKQKGRRQTTRREKKTLHDSSHSYPHQTLDFRLGLIKHHLCAHKMCIKQFSW